MKIDGDDVGDGANACVALAINAAVEGAVADGDHPFWIGRRRIGSLKRFAHVFRHRTGDEQDVGVARRRDKTQAESFEIVIGVVERVDLQLAAIAGARVDFADRQAAAQFLARRAPERVAKFRDRRRIVGVGACSVRARRSKP